MKKVLLFILCLLSVNLYAQRLNSDGLKMISRIRIAQKDTIYFKYDERNRLKEIICPFTDFEEHSEKTRAMADSLSRIPKLLFQRKWFSRG